MRPEYAEWIEAAPKQPRCPACGAPQPKKPYAPPELVPLGGVRRDVLRPA